ncbi:MAG: alpha/beta fold hydrolase [Ferruginibacter sp.]|nr:alpha/beta fold hydrolase [Ferruginibacter sp.]
MNVQKKFALQFIRTKLNVLGLLSDRKAGEVAFKLFCTPLPIPAEKQKDHFHSAEKLAFTVDGKTIRGYRVNHPRPHKILLLHGFSSTCQNFHRFVAPLVAQGYEVLAFDAPAHGKSEGKTVNAVDYANMILKAVELYGPIHSFLAHSFGGMAISLALERMPHSPKTKVVLIAPATETTTAIDTAFSFIGINKPALRKSMDEIIFSISGEHSEWFSIRRAMKNIKASVLWIHDEDDDVTPLSDALKVKEDAWPNVRFIITKGLGHRKIYRDATVKKALLSFLQID